MSIRYTIFSFTNGSPTAGRTLYRKLYGYKYEGKQYKGFLEKHGGVKLGSGAILIRSSYANEIKKLFNALKVKFKTYKVYVKTELLLNKQ